MVLRHISSFRATQEGKLLSSLGLDSLPPIDAYEEGKCRVAEGWAHSSTQEG